MKIVLLIFPLSFFLLSCNPKQKSISLYNGVDLSGWHVDIPAMDTSDVAKNPFTANGSSIMTAGVPGGHLITDGTYKNYRIEVSYRFTGKPGNCGLLVHASTPRTLYGMFPKSIESQMMHENAGDFWVIGEDIECPNMIERRGPVAEWGVTEGAKRRIKNLTDGSENPVGEWNTMIVECFGNEIKVWVNGDLVNYGYNSTVSEGQIALQSEGVPAEFKDIKLTPISRFAD